MIQKILKNFLNNGQRVCRQAETKRRLLLHVSHVCYDFLNTKKNHELNSKNIS